MLFASRTLTLSFLLLLALTSSAFPASVIGRITNTTDEKPVVFATVKLLELNRTVHTDADGKYMFEDVPAGRYTVTLTSGDGAEQSLGMVEASDEAVVTLNAQLQSDGASASTAESDDELQMTVRSGEATRRIGAIRPQDMPIRGYQQYIAIQPGTQRRSYGAPLHVRGGRIEEFSYFVDGFSVQDPYTGESFTALNGNVADEIEFKPGYNDPSDGWLASGQAEVETRETWSTSGSVEAITDNFHGDKSDFNLYAADLSGSLVPNRPGQLTFLVDGEMRTLGNRDVGGPNDWNYLGAWHGKLNWRPKDGSSLMLGTRGEYEDWKYTPRAYYFDAVHAPRGIDENYTIYGTLEQEIAYNTEFEASANWLSSKHRQGDGIYFDDIWAYGRPSHNPLFDETRLFWSWDDILLDTLLVIDEPRPILHTPVVESTLTVPLADGGSIQRSFIIRGDEGSIWDDYFEQKGSYIGGKFELEHRHGSTAETEIGVEFQRHTVRAYNHLFPTLIYQGEFGGFIDVTRYGYDELGNEFDEDGMNGTKHPVFLAGFANQHIDHRELSLDLGIRWDHLDYGGKRLVDPVQPLDPFDRAAYADTASGLTQQERDSLRQTANELSEDEIEDADLVDRLSPRLFASFSVGEGSDLFFSASRSTQRTPFRYVYQDFHYLEYKIRTGGYYYAFGNPSIKPTNTILYEAGVTHKFGSHVELAAAAYYKDIRDRVGTITQPALPNSFSTYANLGGATAKGLELSAALSRTGGIAGDVSYTMSSAEERGNFFNLPNNIAWTVAEPRPVTAPTWYDQRHRFVIRTGFRTGPTGGPHLGDWHPLGNAGIDLLAEIGSGFPYSPAEVHNELTLGAISPRPIGSVNSERTDWTFRVDLKANKSIPVLGADLEFYLWVINLFDRENAAYVYQGTGEPDNTGWLDTGEGQQFIIDNNTILDSSYLTGEQKYELRQNDPANFDIPRQIRLGIRAGF